MEGHGAWAGGEWSAVFVRDLRSTGGMTFAEGQYVPIAFSVWDGTARERGNRRGLTQWFYVTLPPREKPSVAGAVAVAGARRPRPRAPGRGLDPPAEPGATIPTRARQSETATPPRTAAGNCHGGMHMQALEVLFRWIHVLAGVIWIGHLYFFNFVNGPFQGKLDGPTKKAVNPELLPRALWWFRWGAAWTWVTGVLLLGLVYYHGRLAVEAEGFTTGSWVMLAVTFLAPFVYDALYKSPLAANVRGAFVVAYALVAVVVYLFAHFAGFSYRGTLIHTGAMFGTIMAFNVWFRIWPAQQKIVRAVKEGDGPRRRPRQAGRAALPPQHLPVGAPPLHDDRPAHDLLLGRQLGHRQRHVVDRLPRGIIGLGWHVVFQLYKRSAKVQGF